MSDFRNFFSKRKEEKMLFAESINRNKDKDGKIHVALATSVFSDAGDNLLVSNSRYYDLMEGVKSCIESYPTKEKIVVDVYESKEVDDLNKEVIEIGFKKFVKSYFYGVKKQSLSKFLLFFSFLIIGILIEAILYGFLLDFDTGLSIAGFPMWIFKSLEVLGTLFIWQFGGYVAFEFFGDRKKRKRLHQISEIEFKVKHWE